GSVVELADGAVGLVVATHTARADLNTPARPVVALIRDGRGQRLPGPHYLDLAWCEGQSIVRTLSAPERRDVLGQRYPQLARHEPPKHLSFGHTASVVVFSLSGPPPGCLRRRRAFTGRGAGVCLAQRRGYLAALGPGLLRPVAALLGAPAD